MDLRRESHRPGATPTRKVNGVDVFIEFCGDSFVAEGSDDAVVGLTVILALVEATCFL